MKTRLATAKTLAMLCALIAPVIEADPAFKLVMPLASYHTGSVDHNDFNIGLIGQLKPTGEGVFLGTGFYKNSDKNEASDDFSFLFSIGYEKEKITPWLDIGGQVGAVTGYSVNTGIKEVTATDKPCTHKGKYYTSCTHYVDKMGKTLLPFASVSFEFFDRAIVSIAPGKDSVAFNFALSIKEWK